ncbi:MAG: NAD(P)-dependent oxidoreductase [Snowella sp.]|nr:NAD(P)-dependent oxidoreductase [Snowella sp.]
MKRIFVTGVSGCIGHYVAEKLIQNTDHELFLLVRNPAKLKIDVTSRPNIHLLSGDLREIEKFSELLKTINTAILIATSWGDPAETYEINVVKTLALMELLEPTVCEQVIYFSTASILSQQGEPLKEAGTLGTDYIRTKYQCHQALPNLAIADKITTVYPTLVFGGAENKPYSHLSGGLKDILKLMPLIRWFTADGSFHFIHAQDIAQVVGYLVDHPPAAEESRDIVLGNDPLRVEQAIAEIAHYLNQRIYFSIPLSITLANFFIKVFRIQMAAWDRFCLDYRHFTYPNPVNPKSLGLPYHCATIPELLRVSGILKK